MRVVSWFAGIGGFDAAFVAAGHRIVGACEIDEAARKVYAARFGKPAWFARDVAAVTADEIPDADVWCGGFPCTDVSVAGKRAGAGEGTRSGLWWPWQRLMAARKPPLVLAENVPGLLSSSCGRDFGAIVASLLDVGYSVAWATLDARHFGVAQRRRRIFICASLRSDPRAVLFDADAAPRDSGAPDAVLCAGAWTSPQAGLFGSGDAPFAGASWPTSGYAAGDRCWTRTDDEERDGAVRASLAETLERDAVHPRFYLSPKACAGILRRAARRGRDLPTALEAALTATAAGVDADARDDPKMFESRFARNGRGAPSDIVAALKAQAGADGRGDGSPLVMGFYPTAGTHGVDARDDESPAIKCGSGVGIPSAPAVAFHDSASALQGGGQRGHRLDAEGAAGGQLVVGAPGALRAGRGDVQSGVPFVVHAAQSGARARHAYQSDHARCIDGTGGFASAQGGTVVASPIRAQHAPGNGGEHGEADQLVVAGQCGGSDESPTIRMGASAEHRPNGGVAPAVACAGAIRRLSPTECERLMGMADGTTCTCGVACKKPEDRRVPAWWPADANMGGCGHAACGCKCSDGPRYRMLGNSVAVPCVAWIARRLS